MTTDLFEPSSAPATKLPLWATDRLTRRLRVEALLLRTVNFASMPSTVAAPAVTRISGAPVPSLMLKPALPVPRAPPWRLLPVLASRVSRATDTDSAVSTSVSLAACRVSVADVAPPPDWPPKVTVGGLLAGLLLARFE